MLIIWVNNEKENEVRKTMVMDEFNCCCEMKQKLSDT